MGRPARSRAEQIVIDHDLPAYVPQVGDTVVAFFSFRKPEDLNAELEDARARGIAPQDHAAAERDAGRPLAKLRPCMVVAARDGDVMLVPLSSKPHPKGRHMAMHEPSELAAAGLDPSRPAYAKVLEVTQYDTPHPLIFPVEGEDGRPTWRAGQSTTETRRQTALEMRRQIKQGRIPAVKACPAAAVSPALIAEVRAISRDARTSRLAREAAKRSASRQTPRNAATDRDTAAGRPRHLDHAR